MAGYADELSLKLSAKDEMSARLKDVKRELTAVEKQMIDTRREFERTGAPEAAREYERLQAQYESLSRSQRELAKSSSQVKRDLDQIRSKAGQTSTAMGRLGTSIEKHAKTIQRTGLVMGAAMAYFAKQSITAYAGAEKQQAILTAAMGKFPKVADVTRQSFDDLNTSIMNMTGADDDALAAAEGMLARFDLTGTQIQQLIPLVNDYAILMDKDVVDASGAIGKALLGNARALKDLGIDFKSTGDRGRDLAAIMALLEEKAGGAGKAFGETTSGQLAIANQNYENLKESVGLALVPAMQQLVAVMKPAVGMFTSLPEPVKQTAFAFTALGIAAMVATPRLVAFNAALKGIGVSVAALGPIAAILIGGTVAILEAKDAGEKFNTGEKDLTETMTEHSGVLGFVSVGYANLVSVIGRVTGATQDGVTVTRRSAQVTAISARAMERAASPAQKLATEHRSAATAADMQTYAQKRLSGALGRAELLLARRSAMRAYRQSMTDFIAKPSAEAGDAVSAAMLNVANTYKNPEKRARFVKRSYKDLEAAVKGSNLPTDIARKVTTPLHEAYLEARLLLNTMRLIGAANGTTAGNAPYTPIRRAAGGAVFGPGNGTSDSIPAMLSNGEYVIREAAARAIGYDQLDRLNKADRMPSLPAIVNAPAITISNPGGIGRDAPLIAQANFYPTGQVDLELALAREARRQDREQRTRYAGSGRR